MTKKDYVKAAKITQALYSRAKEMTRGEAAVMEVTAKAVEDAFALFFRDDNPRFDKERFSEACKP
jgi:hypothetical protein